MLWDGGNLALAGKYGVTKDEVDTMFALGEWIALPHRTRPDQVYLVGPTAEAAVDRLIVCAAQVRDTPGGRRFRPIVARPASSWHEQAWRDRRRLQENH